VYSKESKYYFDKGNNEFIIATRKNIQKKFSDKKSLVEKYLQEHELDYNNEVDLKNLFVYLASF
jgi:hypothetical protein